MSTPFRAAWRRVVLSRDPASLRLWAVVLPIHLVAFAVLSFGTYRLLEEAYLRAGAVAARRQIEQLVREMPTMMPPVSVGGRSPHVYSRLDALQQPIALRFYSNRAAQVWPRTSFPNPEEVERVRRLLADAGREDEVWTEKAEGREWVRGVFRVNTGHDCLPCHEPGKTVGAASVKVDLTRDLKEIHLLLGKRVTLLLATWVLLAGGVALAVQRTVRRSLSRLETDLDAAASGRGEPDAAPELPLDPASAAFHRRLRDFVRGQRAREAEVASRLVHADQLASLGQLAAGLAHEIKNPLAGIHGALEVLKHQTGDEVTAHLYEEMLGELKRVNGILERLLESGRPAPLRLVRTNVTRLLTETVELMQPALGRRKVEVRADIAPGLPEIQVDAAKIRQVLLNLIQNAGEAIGERGGHVTVRASRLAGGDDVVLAVGDDGPGISPADLDRLFEPFFSTKFTGTGLGLAISKSLVEQHGGHMDVATEPGLGTTFFVFLPGSGRAASPASGEVS